MDWSKIISEILWMEEISEKQLCATLTIPISQQALSRLKNGHTKMPLYNLGHELMQRHKKLLRLQPKDTPSKGLERGCYA